MNILFFLKPKQQVVYIYDDFTIRQALEKMEYHRYTSIPIINKEGDYIGTLSEGDILWEIKNRHQFNLSEAENTKISDVQRLRDNLPIDISAQIDDLILKATIQNFVPVIDDRKKFIGIVTRTDIIKYFFESQNKSFQDSI
ncbi:MAG: CBS domain-containing protein [Prevotella sp.]|nr:CBS domain-containing protein [Staphylococcus sp.]MCM1350406.1 CBS domain-containing protein [Prevotella sp.]